MPATITSLPRRASRGREVFPLTLTRDGRLARAGELDRLARAAQTATDCFLFCHGWLYDEAEARDEARRVFALLDRALAPFGERVVPVRVALHWPSKPFADAELTRAAGHGTLWPELERRLHAEVRGRGGLPQRAADAGLMPVLRELCAAEIARSPEEQLELDALTRRLAVAARERGALPISPFHALSFWVMKRRAGEVGERVGRETLAPLWRSLPRVPRLHLVGHSFGAKLATSIVLGGVASESLTLLLGAFSAFAFAPEVPASKRPGFYYPVLAERRVTRSIVVLRSDHDTALATLYRSISGNGEIGRTAVTVATSALGAVGARGVAAPEVDLVDAQQIGLPRYPIVNVDGSRIVRAKDRLVGAHRDIYHAEVANLVLLAAGLLVGGPDGIRPVPVDPLVAR